VSVDLDIRKCVHLRFRTDVHAGLKMACESLELSMQVVLEELASKVVEGDPYIMEILSGVSSRKFENKLKYKPKIIIHSDVDSLYDYFDTIDKNQKDEDDVNEKNT